MKIIIVLGSAVLGGAERQALVTAKYLREQYQYQVHIVLFRNPGGPVSQLCDEYQLPWQHIPFSDLGKTIYPYQIIKYAFLFRKLQPDVIMSYTDGPNTLCGLIWKWTGARLFVWSQRSSHLLPRYPFLMERALQNTPLVISNSQVGIDAIRSQFPKATQFCRFIKIYNGFYLPPPRYNKQQWRQRLGIDPDVIVALMIANLSLQYKDHPTLLNAWKLVTDNLQKQDKKTMLLLAGELEPTSQQLIDLCFELNLFSSVRFLGKVDDISGLAQACDILVHSSQMEGISNGILEGMACGLPVVATRIPGIQETLGDENYEWLAPPTDAKTMAEKIIMLALDPSLRKHIGTRNKQRVLQVFSPDTMAANTHKAITHHLK